MKNNLPDVKFLYPEDPGPGILARCNPMEPFAEETITWLHALSLVLKRDPETRGHPDVATFAFFCRRANLLQLKKKYYPGSSLRLGRGLVFHITPKNVPVTFAWSLLCGMLAGNANIVKVPSEISARADILCRAISDLGKVSAFRPVSSRQVLVRYAHENPATAFFSSMCDVRMIWGGDATIGEIRKNILPPRAFDVTFASRYSLCVIHAGSFMTNPSPGKVAAGFYNDTYLSAQEACTSPHLVAWLGSDNEVAAARSVFWDHVYKIVKSRYHLQPHAAVDKLTTFCLQAAQSDGIKKTVMPDNLVWRTELKSLPEDIDRYRCGGGYFSECRIHALSDLSATINGKYQTLSYFGIEKEELENFITRGRPGGIDNIIPIGRSLEFSLIRDGYNLVDTLSREITVT